MTVDYKDLFEIVKDTIFTDIYNYAEITLKNNIRLTILNNGIAVRGMLYNNVIAILLPDPLSSFYLFICSNQAISNLFIDAEGWTSLEDTLNLKKVNADLVTIDNQMIPKCMVYGRVTHSGNTILAIDSRVYKQLKAPTETYLIIDVDTTHSVGNRTVISSIPVINPNITTILNTVPNYPENQLLGFINGYAYRMDTFLTSGNPNKDYYELYHDADVKFTFAVDLTHRNTYMCTEQAIYKDIVVIPQNLTNGEAFTFDSIQLVVMSYSGKGVILPFIASNSISQLTHASFSVGSYLIDAAFDKLGVTDGLLYVIVSDYNKNNTNVLNGDITEQLYLLDDTKIMSALTNTLNPAVPYWTAESLGASVYAKYLVDMTELDTYDQSLFSKEIKCLGYYSFVNTICKHSGEIKDLGTADITNLTIAVPKFWSDTDVYPILYADGNKISSSRYTISRVGNDLEVTFSNPYVLNFSNSVIQYDIILNPKIVTYRCTASSSLQSIQKPKSGSLHVFVKTETNLLGLTTDMYIGYSEIPFSTGDYFSIIDHDTDSYILEFNQSSYGKEFIIMLDSVTTINSYPDVDISAGKSIFFVPNCPVIGVDNPVNILTPGSYDVYLNGKYLIDGFDYIVTPIKNDTLIGGYAIVLQNLKFLNDTQTNTVEIIKTDRTILSTDIGYVVGGIIPRNVNNEAWIQGISKLFINGKLVPFDCVTKTNTHFEIDQRYWSNGYIYQFINSVSTDFYNAYLPYMDNSYFDGRRSISQYFTHGYSYTYPNPIIIDYGNKIFSSYLNEIINRIIAGEITINYINDDADIIQQLSAYEHLKEFDVIFSDANNIDKRFVDLYPGYLATLSITDLNHYMYIQRLVKIVLGPDAITDYKIVYTGN